MVVVVSHYDNKLRIHQLLIWELALTLVLEQYYVIISSYCSNH